MTYGVDECRVCGTKIKPRGPEAMRDYLEMLRKPPMAEAEWRRLGFRACPTEVQLRRPALGCCQTCGLKQTRRVMHIWRRFGIAVGCGAAFVAFAFGIALYLTR